MLELFHDKGYLFGAPRYRRDVVQASNDFFAMRKPVYTVRVCSSGDRSAEVDSARLLDIASLFDEPDDDGAAGSENAVAPAAGSGERVAPAAGSGEPVAPAAGSGSQVSSSSSSSSGSSTPAKASASPSRNAVLRSASSPVPGDSSAGSVGSKRKVTSNK